MFQFKVMGLTAVLERESGWHRGDGERFHNRTEIAPTWSLGWPNKTLAIQKARGKKRTNTHRQWQGGSVETEAWSNLHTNTHAQTEEVWSRQQPKCLADTLSGLWWTDRDYNGGRRLTHKHTRLTNNRSVLYYHVFFCGIIHLSPSTEKHQWRRIVSSSTRLTPELKNFGSGPTRKHKIDWCWLMSVWINISSNL